MNAFNSWEGYQIAFNGTKGCPEQAIVEQIYVNAGAGVQGGIEDGGATIMLDDIFLPAPPADKCVRASDGRGWACSILIGAAADCCFQKGQSVKIPDLVAGLRKPDYPPMPSHAEPVPIPR